MHCDTSSTFQGLNQRFREAGRRVDRAVALRDRIEGDLSAQKQELDQHTQRLTDLDLTIELFRQLMRALVEKQVGSIEKTVTRGLQTIMSDQNMNFEAHMVPKHNKIWIEFQFRQGDEDDPLAVRGSPLRSFGGGPAQIASFVLRLSVLLRMGRYPLMALDEALCWVSEQYIERTGLFIKKVAEETGVSTLLVTHKPGFLEYADRAYQAEQRSDGTELWVELREIPN